MRIAAVTTVAALAVALAVSAPPPPQAQTVTQTAEEPAGPGAEKPLSEQLEEAIRGLVESVEPALEQLRDTFRVFERVDSLENYEEPEILPNGDIIIRRKEAAPPYDPPPYDPESAPEDPSDPGIRT